MKIKNRKKVITITLFLTILLIAGCFVFFQKPQQAEASWWDDTWLYRKPVAITNASTAQTDFQVMITLDTAALITAKTMQADCDDIRLTDINSNVISYWMEPGTCDDVATKIWAKVPSVPASNATIYVYYGNPAAASESSPTETFIREIAGVQGAWDMDEASWTNDCSTSTVLDASGNSNDGKSCPSGDGTQPSTGKFGNAGVFDGSNDYVDAGAGASLNITDAITIEAWVKPISVQDGWHAIAGKSTAGDRAHSIYMLVHNNNDISFVIGDGSNWQEHNRYNLLVANVWTHIVVVLTDTSLISYINSVASSPTTRTITPSIVVNPVQVGIWHNNYPFNGTIDQVRIYSQALSQAEITDLYGTGGDRQGYVTTNYPNKSLVRKYSASVTVGSAGTEEKGPGPVAYWSFDEGYGDTAYDSSDNANDGDLAGVCPGGATCPTWQTEDMCVSGKCLHFDGTDDYVDCGQGASLNITDAITIEAWVKINILDSTYRPIVDVTPHYPIKLTTDDQIRFQVSTVNGYNSVYFLSPQTDIWYHLALTYDKDDSTNGLVVYVNGDRIGNTNTYSGALSSITGAWKISSPSSSPNYPFNGSIDEVRIYPYARTATQIKKDYLAGLAGMGGGTEGVGAALGSPGQKWMTDGLVGYWKMDEGSANTCANGVNDSCDSSGNGNDGAWAGNATSATGKFGNGVTFDGTGDYVDVGDISETSAQTVALWVKPDAVNVTEEVLDLNGTQYVKITNGTVTGEGFTSPTVYVDGSAASTVTAAWHHIVITTDTGFSASDVDIGRLETSSDFDGSIDQVRIYNRALSPKEVRDLYNFAPGPVLHLKMDEKVSGDSQTLYDTSGQENNATTDWGENASGMDCSIPGKFGAACQFDGADDYVSVGDFGY